MATAETKLPLGPVRRAIFRRMVAQIKAAVRGATEEQILKAVEAPTAVGTIAELLAAVPAHTGEVGEWAEELLRGAAAKQELLEAAGGTYSTAQVAALLGRSVPTVQQRLRRKSLLAVPLANGEWGFPACQFTPSGPFPGLGRVLRAFGSADPWVQLSVLLSSDPTSGEGRTIDRLRDAGGVEEVERIARSYGEQGAL